MMNITYSTPNPHGFARDLLIDLALAEMERKGETLPDSREVRGEESGR